MFESGHLLDFFDSGNLYFTNSAFLVVSHISNALLSFPMEKLIVFLGFFFVLPDAESEISAAAHFPLVDLLNFIFHLLRLSFLGKKSSMFFILMHPSYLPEFVVP